MLRKTLFFCFLCLSFVSAKAQFSTYFEDKTIRIDYKRAGSGICDSICSVNFMEKPGQWAGSLTQLINPFNYGNFRLLALDKKTKQVIYSHTYSSLLGEWKITPKGCHSTCIFEECVLIPKPKKPIVLEFQSRDKNLEFKTIHTKYFDPKKTKINKIPKNQYSVKPLLHSGNSHKKMDIVIVPDGYSIADSAQMMENFKFLIEGMMEYSVFNESKDKINIWGLVAFSDTSGINDPLKNITHQTVAGASFNTLDIERYLMTEKMFQLHNAIQNVPYDHIIVMSNTKEYGGGAIYNYYATVSLSSDAKFVVTHELGHSIGNLADEYVDKGVSYQDLYAKGKEPLEPNITNLTDFKCKWKDLVDSNTPIPCPSAAEYKAKIGAFEGAGYVEKGFYRPTVNCVMRSATAPDFCPVCKKAMQDIFEFYSK